jgi:transcriptional antiterminator NusG
VGPESKPVPLTDEELNTMKIEVQPIKIEFDTGDVVRIIDGPLNGYLGKVLEIVTDKSKVKLSVDLFMGRETEVDLDISQVESID